MGQVGIAGNVFETYGASAYFNAFALGSRARNLKSFWDFNDFLQAFASTGESNGIWNYWGSGAGVACVNYGGTTLRPGIIYLSTGTTNTGYAGLFGAYTFSGSGLAFGAGTYELEADIQLPILSAVAEEYIFRFGFGDDDNADFVDGAYFEYDRLTNVNWLAKTAANSVRTATDTGVAVDTNWTRLRVAVNVDATAVAFYLNDTLVATNVLNIPSGAGRELIPVMTIVKSAGATARTFRIDWAWFHCDLLASR